MNAHHPPSTHDPDVPATDRGAARHAILTNLPVVCTTALADLWDRAYPGVAQDTEVGWFSAAVRGEEILTKADPLAAARRIFQPIVRTWATSYGLAAEWLVAQLTDVLEGHPRLSDVTANTWRYGGRPSSASLIAEWVSVLDDESPMCPPRARPWMETQAAFIECCRAHYQAHASVLVASGERVTRDRPDLDRHARWLLRHRVGRESYAAIAASDAATRAAVSKAVQRFAPLADLPPQ